MKRIKTKENIASQSQREITEEKMPQRRDNAGAVCDSGMGILFLNR